jgi:hypothetical protein
MAGTVTGTVRRNWSGVGDRPPVEIHTARTMAPQDSTKVREKYHHKGCFRTDELTAPIMSSKRRIL